LSLGVTRLSPEIEEGAWTTCRGTAGGISVRIQCITSSNQMVWRSGMLVQLLSSPLLWQVAGLTPGTGTSWETECHTFTGLDRTAAAVPVCIT